MHTIVAKWFDDIFEWGAIADSIFLQLNMQRLVSGGAQEVNNDNNTGETTGFPFAGET